MAVNNLEFKAIYNCENTISSRDLKLAGLYWIEKNNSASARAVDTLWWNSPWVGITLSFFIGKKAAFGYRNFLIWVVKKIIISFLFQWFLFYNSEGL